MSTLQEIEQAISELPPEGLAQLRAWLEEFEETRGDASIQRMFTPERLDHIDQALEDVDNGRFFTAEQVSERFSRKAAS